MLEPKIEAGVTPSGGSEQMTSRFGTDEGVTSDAKSGPVYVRMRAFAGPEYEKNLKYTRGDGWSDAADAEGWWYYGPILQANDSASPFVVELVDLPEGTLLTEGDSVNIVIVYEYTPVLYDEAGNAYADWDLVLKVGGEA